MSSANAVDHIIQAKYILLPATESWRQALVMPAIALRDDGVVLDRRISSCMLWLELPSGKVWGITFKSRTAYLSISGIVKIAERLACAQQNEIACLPQHLEKLLGWFACRYTSEDDVNEIAEDLVREDVNASKVRNYQYLLTVESVRRLAQPSIEQFCEGFHRFNASLDQEALLLSGASGTTGTPDSGSYNYQFHPVSKIGLYRRQAMQSLPLLAQALTTQSSDHRMKRLQQSVDSGNPLLSALSDCFRCSKNLARFLSQKDYTLIGNEWQGKLDQLTGLLGIVKPDFWPVSSDDWHNFNQWLRPLHSAFSNRNNPVWQQIMANGVNELASEGYGQIVTRMERHDIALVDILTLPDFARDLGKWVEQFGGNKEQAETALQQYSLFRLALLSRRWHLWQAQTAGEVPTEPGKHGDDSASGWLTFIDEPWEKWLWPHSRYSVVPLNTPLLLAEEGSRMKHCVGGYTGKCRYYGSHIFSIREQATGISLSTAELRFGIHDKSSDDISLMQHYGFQNATPSDHCKTVLQSFRQYLHKVSAARLLEIKKQLHARNQEMEAERIASQAWPAKKLEGFRELLRGYPALEAIGQSQLG
ncbi:MAG: PcfJ domain-containing protein [Desulfuromonadales bacterium]